MFERTVNNLDSDFSNWQSQETIKGTERASPIYTLFEGLNGVVAFTVNG